MKKALILGALCGVVIVSILFWQKELFAKISSQFGWNLPSSLVHTPTKPLPYLQYTIPNLRQRTFQTSHISVEKLLATYPTYFSYLFSFQTLDKKMTGVLNVPKEASVSAFPVIILVRGYVPPEIYKSGVGTQPAAAVFAQHGYVTFSLDFFGYGGSDVENPDTWAARFQKPISVVELISSITAQTNFDLPVPNLPSHFSVDPQHMGMWAHSNGGQIALTTLEILPRPIPTTLWAPVTAPFPYSILYFSDEDPDEGKANRLMIAQFERKYDVTQFSLTDFLPYLHEPIQIHQGLQDEAIHFTWSGEFVDKLKKENTWRTEAVANASAAAEVATTTSSETSSPSAQLDPQLHPYLDIFPVTFYTYPDTDHNMRPAWNTVIQRDLDFFNVNLK